MTPLEEQVEKLARTIEHEIRTIETEGLIHVAGPDDTPPRMNIREASGRLARACVSALLPLEVTDESPLRVTVDTADLIELLYGATTDIAALDLARTEGEK